MTEQELRKTLRQDIELPGVVEARLAQAYDQARAAERPVPRRRPLHPLRTGLVAAAVCAALCVGAGAAYLVNHSDTFQAFFGDETYQSTQYAEGYDEYGNFYIWSMNEERVPVDEEQAEALVGAYLSEEGYVWQVGEYTMTIESYLLDENTGTAKVSYSLHRDGGVQGLIYDDLSGELNADGSGIGIPQFWVRINDPESLFYEAGESTLASNERVDLTRSTEDTLYITASMAQEGWKAADGLQVRFLDLSRINRSDPYQPVDLVVDTLNLPGLESLPAITITNPETGAPAAVISSIGMLLDCSYLVEGDFTRDISITYADGSTYLVRDNVGNVQNYDYALGSGSGSDKNLRLVFNRLVDPEQVVSVTVDGTTYAVE